MKKNKLAFGGIFLADFDYTTWENWELFTNNCPPLEVFATYSYCNLIH